MFGEFEVIVHYIYDKNNDFGNNGRISICVENDKKIRPKVIKIWKINMTECSGFNLASNAFDTMF